MALFLSRFDNKVDRKGRVSVPAQYRAALAAQPFQGIVAYPSPIMATVEACGLDRFEQLADGLDQNFNQFSNEYQVLSNALLGRSHQLSFDSEGRIMLPDALIEHAGITDTATFSGRGRIFQIWSPAAYEVFEAETAAQVRDAAPNIDTVRLLRDGNSA